jgi:hypothetical protein
LLHGAGIVLRVGLGGGARGQTVELAHSDPLRSNTWELVAVTVAAPAGGGTVGLRDVRGGPVVTRVIPQGAGRARVLVPLPAVGLAELPEGRWPVEVTVTGADGAVQRERMDVDVPSMGAETRALRLAVLTETETVPSAVAALGGTRPELVHVSEDDLLNGPALVFAGVDAVYLPHRLMQNFPEERAAALAAAGVRLLATEDDEAGLAALRRLAWVHVNRADGAPPAEPLWAFPAAAVPAPAPVGSGLAAIPGFLAPAAADGRVRGLIGVVPLGALVALLLVAGTFRREWLIMSVGGAVMVGWTVIAVALMHARAPEARRQAGWIAGGSGLRLEESVGARAALFPQGVSVDAQDGEILWPAWPTTAACLGDRGVRLRLDLPAESGIGRQSILEADLGHRDGVAFLRRLGHTDISFHAGSGADVGRLDPTASAGAWWIVGGHATEARGDPPTVAAATPGPSFVEWLARHPDTAADGRAWYELRFDARERYLLLTVPNEPPRFLRVSGTGS